MLAQVSLVGVVGIDADHRPAGLHRQVGLPPGIGAADPGDSADPAAAGGSADGPDPRGERRTDAGDDEGGERPDRTVVDGPCGCVGVDDSAVGAPSISKRDSGSTDSRKERSRCWAVASRLKTPKGWSPSTYRTRRARPDQVLTDNRVVAVFIETFMGLGEEPPGPGTAGRGSCCGPGCAPWRRDRRSAVAVAGHPGLLGSRTAPVTTDTPSASARAHRRKH
ncbi:hypothetical protein BH24ACT7_BH24ACT7_24370 [soil metagenome]